MNDGLPSIGFLIEEARLERERQIGHFEALDSKAGIVLGFAGALAAFGGPDDGPAQIAGHALAVLAALLALLAFWPRRFPALDLLRLRERYLRADERFTRLHMLDTQIAMSRATSRLLDSKALRLRLALISLFGATVSAATGIITSPT